MRKVHTVVLDWDGTSVKNEWPGMGEFMPGFTRNMPRLHAAGIHLKVNSARLNPNDPFTGAERDPAFVAMEHQKVRAMLDEAGLPYIDIWRLPGKPGASRYVDDRAVYYPGTPRAWDRITDRLLLELAGIEPEFPNQEGELSAE